MPVQLAVMDAAYRDGELVADLAAERPRLGKTQMVSIGRRPAAHYAGLRGHEFAVVLVSQPNGLGRHVATADARLFWKRCWGLCGFRIRSGQLCPNRALSSLRKFPGLLITNGREPDPEARFDQLGINHGQGVLGWQAPMRPIGCIIGRL